MIKMIVKSKNFLSFLIALCVHLAGIFLFQSSIIEKLTFNKELLEEHKQTTNIDNIKLVDREELEKFKKVGIKGGKKDAFTPDRITQLSKPQVLEPKKDEKKVGKITSLSQLAPDLNLANIDAPKDQALKSAPTALGSEQTKIFLDSQNSSDSSHFYYSPSKGGVIQRSREQDNIKKQASSNSPRYVNPTLNSISNFEIRYDRPEGVSEDELNSDEKAYYSFYVRSYQNYFQKIYSTYEKTLIEKPALPRAFSEKHILIGKIDYDENGDIVRVRILKSSENDDLHYFFEETLKQLNQPNPPKVFLKNKKEFSMYYQLQVN